MSSRKKYLHMLISLEASTNSHIYVMKYRISTSSTIIINYRGVALGMYS